VHARRGELARARDLLEEALSRHPGYLGLVDPLAGVLLRLGLPATEVAERVEAGVAETTPSVRFLLGTALYEAGHVTEAEAQFAGVLAAQPFSGPARVALAEAQLSQGRFADAAATAAAIAAGDPWAPAAARTELFARLAGDDLAGARARLDGPTAVRLQASDEAFYRGWLETAEGRKPEDLPATAFAPLATALEALLRVDAYDAFELLADLPAACGVSPRGRRELLAGMYLRRGFVDLACEEWMAACEEQGVDAPALIGLAQVAAIRGLSEDALVLAEEARALAPDDAGAAKLLEALSAA
jgi:tetratricopeptide (TPR) repeat protein